MNKSGERLARLTDALHRGVVLSVRKIQLEHGVSKPTAERDMNLLRDIIAGVELTPGIDGRLQRELWLPAKPCAQSCGQNVSRGPVDAEAPARA